MKCAGLTVEQLRARVLAPSGLSLLGLVRLGADHPGAETVFISCTALPTFDVFEPLEERLGKPVISANQATARALPGAVAERADSPGQRLFAGSSAGKPIHVPNTPFGVIEVF